MNPPDHLLTCHLDPSCRPHDAVVVAVAGSAVGHPVYVEIAETMTVASEDRANYLGATDPSRPDCKHCSHVVVDDAEGYPAVARDSAL